MPSSVRERLGWAGKALPRSCRDSLLCSLSTALGTASLSARILIVHRFVVGSAFRAISGNGR
jgi:hypothetical protein